MFIKFLASLGSKKAFSSSKAKDVPTRTPMKKVALHPKMSWATSGFSIQFPSILSSILPIILLSNILMIGLVLIAYTVQYSFHCLYSLDNSPFHQLLHESIPRLYNMDMLLPYVSSLFLSPFRFLLFSDNLVFKMITAFLRDFHLYFLAKRIKKPDVSGTIRFFLIISELISINLDILYIYLGKNLIT